MIFFVTLCFIRFLLKLVLVESVFVIPENLSIHICVIQLNPLRFKTGFCTCFIDPLIHRASLVDVIMIFSCVSVSLENDGASFENLI